MWTFEHNFSDIFCKYFLFNFFSMHILLGQTITNGSVQRIFEQVPKIEWAYKFVSWGSNVLHLITLSILVLFPLLPNVTERKAQLYRHKHKLHSLRRLSKAWSVPELISWEVYCSF